MIRDVFDPPRYVPPAPPTASTATRRLRWIAIGLVAAALLAAGGTKLLASQPNVDDANATVTMVSRYLPSPRAVRAGGCLEIALALWLMSGLNPKLSPAVAAGALAGMTLLVGSELRRDRPLPCGCFPVRAAAVESLTARRELSVAVGRNVFLIGLCGLAITLTPRATDEQVDRYA